MIITVASYKGGIAKTTTAIHLDAVLNAEGRGAVLVDADVNRSATRWAARGRLPFPVIDEREAAKFLRDGGRDHVVIDTAARPSREEFEALARTCDLLVLPSTPDPMSLDAMLATVEALRALGPDRFRVLLSIVPPKPSRDGDHARAMVKAAGLPVFDGIIRRAVAFQRASLLGCVVSAAKDQKAADAWGDYLAVGAEILR